MKPASIADPTGTPTEARFENSSNADAMSGPAFYRGTFEIKTSQKVIPDTFLDVCDLGNGTVWINGHPLGRYWNIGP